MKTYKLLSIAFLFACTYACNSGSSQQSESVPESPQAETQTATNKRPGNNRLMDTTGLYNAPVQITSNAIVSVEGRKSVKLSYKNTSAKNIDAIRFSWYVENAFREPASVDGVAPGLGGGLDDVPLKAGRATTGKWDLYAGTDANKIILVWPREIVFSDGSKWKIGKDYQ